jgi:hypothetical protein
VTTIRYLILIFCLYHLHLGGCSCNTSVASGLHVTRECRRACRHSNQLARARPLTDTHECSAEYTPELFACLHASYLLRTNEIPYWGLHKSRNLFAQPLRHGELGDAHMHHALSTSDTSAIPCDNLISTHSSCTRMLNQSNSQPNPLNAVRRQCARAHLLRCS